MFSMSSAGCSRSNQEAVINAEMMGLKANQEKSGHEGRLKMWPQHFFAMSPARSDWNAAL